MVVAALLTLKSTLMPPAPSTVPNCSTVPLQVSVHLLPLNVPTQLPPGFCALTAAICACVAAWSQPKLMFLPPATPGWPGQSRFCT